MWCQSLEYTSLCPSCVLQAAWFVWLWGCGLLWVGDPAPMCVQVLKETKSLLHLRNLIVHVCLAVVSGLDRYYSDHFPFLLVHSALRRE